MNRISLAIFSSTCLLISAAVLARAQTPSTAPARGAIEGVVLDSVTGRPIEGVQVTINVGQPLPETGVQSMFRNQKPVAQGPQVSGAIPALIIGNRTLDPERAVYSVLTDSNGKFAFTGLVSASYSLSLRADGYNFQVFGEKPDSSTWLPIDIRDSKQDLGELRMSPEGRITGTVVDLDGHSVPKMPVYLLNAQPTVSIDNDRRFRIVNDALTDDNGHYQFQRIAAGSYFIVAGSSGSAAMVNMFAALATAAERTFPAPVSSIQPQPYTYYPSVSDVMLAWQIDVRAGSKVELKDLVLSKPDLRSIRGRVLDTTTGKPPKSVRVTLTTLLPFTRAGSNSTEPLSNMKYDPTTGQFEAQNLIPGSYRVDAVLPTQPSTPTISNFLAQAGGVSPESTFELAEVRNVDVQDLVLEVPSRNRITGKVTVADGKPFPVPDIGIPIPFQFMLQPLSPLQPAPLATAVSLVDGTFEVASGLEGKYRFNLVPLRDNYYVSETLLNGSPITNGILDFPKNVTTELKVTLTPGVAIKGSVVDKKGQPVKQAQGLLLPDPLPDSIPISKLIIADANGAFTVESVPPGNYRIYIWEGIDRNQFYDRDLLLRSSGKATMVRAEKGSTVSVTVPIITP